MYKKNKNEKKFDCERKRTFFYLFFLSITTLKHKDSDFLCPLCFLSLYLFWLTACTFNFFYLPIHAKSWTDKSETLGKLSKHQSL